MNKDTIRRYIWLVDTIMHAGQNGITLKDIQDRWDRSTLASDEAGSVDNNTKYAPATFHRHCRDIEAIFNVEIRCNKAENSYYIPADDDVRDSTPFMRWMIDSISMDNLIGENKALHDRIIGEPLPGGRDNIEPLLIAMKDNHRVQYNYHPFWKDEYLAENIEPYFLKAFNQRWYLIARRDDGVLRTYALDRMSKVEQLDSTFQLHTNGHKNNGFDGAAFFSQCYGIINGEESKAEHLVINVNRWQANYLRSLPMHPSQNELTAHQVEKYWRESHPDGKEYDSENFTAFECNIKLTFDLKQEILSHGADYEVLHPQHFRNEIKESINAMTECYR